MKKVTNSITLDNFAFPVVGTYELTTPTGIVTIEITERISNFGTGNQTVYTGTFDGTTIEKKPIGYWKKQFGATVNHYSNFSTAKVLTDDELAKAVTAYESKVIGAVNALNAVIEKADGTKAVAIDISYLCDSFRARLVESNDKAKAEREKAEQAKAERDAKAEKRELAKAVTTLSDIQAELVKAVIAGDVAKIAELSAKIA